MNYKIIISIVLVLSVSAASAGMYKWVDANGKTHYSDRPPAKNVQQKSISAETYSDVEVRAIDASIFQYESKDAAGNKRVVMYSAEWCGVCKKAKAYFDANDIAFSELDIDKSAKARRDYEKLGARGVPVILVGKQRMNGFSASGFEEMYYN